MVFNVPQFIEHEPKIVGPFTFKQFLYVGVAGGALFFLYFMIPSLVLFIFVAIILFAGALALAFFKIGGVPLPAIIKNILAFSTKPRIYLWMKKKGGPPKVIKKIEKVEEKKEESPLKVTGKSRLGELFTFLETKQK